MGVKELWTVLTPHAERKPMSELRGKTVAIDLAGWICESLNVVDYFVHPRHHLKNLFFRTCYLIWADVMPIFVLEGAAPKLKSQVMAKRNELQFRGTKPSQSKRTDSQLDKPVNANKGRTRFNHVLKQCESLLQSMGVQCVQGPGEAEAYCAFLNKKKLVDGVISQDSDCFAYGAERVYRNFSVSTQGAQAAQGGAVDIYDMEHIRRKMDFGQHKAIVMALLCGCDYCPDGVGGVGRDGVLKLFNKYKENEILERIRSWRREDTKYTALEMRVDDKTICSNCGHLGRTQSHTKSGCGMCRTNRGCDDSLWKEERLALKAELILRKKALADPLFPCEEIVQEFLDEPDEIPSLNLTWNQPNIVKFIKQIGHLLQWTEIYCFQKFLPVLTRWHVLNAQRLRILNAVAYIEPREIVKKRIVKGVPSLQLIWKDEKGFFTGLIPYEQIKELEEENPKGLQELWSTVEPLCMLQTAYPDLVNSFIKSKEKPKKVKAKVQRNLGDIEKSSSLENFNDLIAATNELAKSTKPRRQPKRTAGNRKGLQLIDKFFKQPPTGNVHHTPHSTGNLPYIPQCSTPLTTSFPSDLESDCDDAANNISEIVNGIVKNTAVPGIKKHAGRMLYYEPIATDLSLLLNEQSLRDDLDLMTEKRNLSIASAQAQVVPSKRISLDDSFDVLVNKKRDKLKSLLETTKNENNRMLFLPNHVDRFKQQNHLGNSSMCTISDIGMHPNDVSYFFNQSANEPETDAFEKLMDLSFSKNLNTQADADVEGCVLISDTSSEDLS